MEKHTNNRKEYLHKVRRDKVVVRLSQFLFIGIFLFLWEYLTYVGTLDPFILSSPTRMVKMFITLSQSDLMVHIMTTVGETLVGFFIGALLGFIIAVILWFSSFANRIFSPFLVVLNSLPKIALGPVIIVWAGAGMSAIIVMAVAISLIVTVLELSAGFDCTDTNLITTVKSFGASKVECFYKIVLPYNIPIIFQSLKVNIGLSLVGVIAGEFLVSKAGLGYLIVYAGQVFKMDLVMMSVVLLGIIAFLMYAFIQLAEKIVIRLINRT